jgi:hypothetical protein
MPLCKAACARSAQRGRHNGKSAATEMTDDIISAAAVRQNVSHGSNDFVAKGKPVVRINPPKPVDVTRNATQSAVKTPRLRDFTGQRYLKVLAVAQSSQAINHRLLFEHMLGPKGSAHALGKFFGLKWLGDVADCPQTQRVNLFFDFAISREKDHWNRGRLGLGLEAAANIQSVDVRHIHIKQN